MEKTEEIFEIQVAKRTVENLLSKQRVRFRRKNYTFNWIEITDRKLPDKYDMALSRDHTTLYVREMAMRCLLHTTSVTCKMDKQVFKFVLDGSEDNGEEKTICTVPE